MIVKRNYAEANFIKMISKRIEKCDAKAEDTEDEYLKTFSILTIELLKNFAENGC